MKGQDMWGPAAGPSSSEAPPAPPFSPASGPGFRQSGEATAAPPFGLSGMGFDAPYLGWPTRQNSRPDLLQEGQGPPASPMANFAGGQGGGCAQQVGSGGWTPISGVSPLSPMNQMPMGFMAGPNMVPMMGLGGCRMDALNLNSPVASGPGPCSPGGSWPQSPFGGGSPCGAQMMGPMGAAFGIPMQGPAGQAVLNACLGPLMGGPGGPCSPSMQGIPMQQAQGPAMSQHLLAQQLLQLQQQQLQAMMQQMQLQGLAGPGCAAPDFPPGGDSSSHQDMRPQNQDTQHQQFRNHCPPPLQEDFDDQDLTPTSRWKFAEMQRQGQAQAGQSPNRQQETNTRAGGSRRGNMNNRQPRAAASQAQQLWEENELSNDFGNRRPVGRQQPEDMRRQGGQQQFMPASRHGQGDVAAGTAAVFQQFGMCGGSMMSTMQQAVWGGRQNRWDHSHHNAPAHRHEAPPVDVNRMSLAEKLQAAKLKLKHVEQPPTGYGGLSFTPPKRGAKATKNAPAPRLPAAAKGGVTASWVLHDPSELARRRQRQEEDPEESEEEQEEDEDQKSLKSVTLRLISKVPFGCSVTVNLNGEAAILQPEGAVFSGQNKTHEKRFNLLPIFQAGGGSPQSITLEAASDSSSPSRPSQGGSSSSTSPPPVVAAPLSPLNREPAAFVATVTLDCGELQAKTAQALKEPLIDVMEVHDNAVVLKMSNLTGERFELTIYASGGGEDGQAATLVQRGPVRTTESVHRIGHLECSTVYVAWVKVFSDDKNKESRQKGFKTLPAREKTIWDEKDHIILGVSENATSKEITKAWRAKSLQHHPDKETDPEKKEAAEEMMKRLNLAKSNMMKSLQSSGNDTPSDSCDTPTSPPGGASSSWQPFGRQNSSSNSEDDDGDSDDSSEFGRSQSFEARNDRATPKGKKVLNKKLDRSQSDLEEEDEIEEHSVCCSLRVEAPRPPKLRLVERGLTTLEVEATGLSLDSTIEVQKWDTEIDNWKAALPAQKVTKETMRFSLDGLEENHPYKLRLRTIVDVAPLRFLHSQFALDEPEQSAKEPLPTEVPASPPAAATRGLGFANRRRNQQGRAGLEKVSEGEEEEVSVDEEDM